ncbi:hypothetical protein MMC28_007088 [Mycoblastus sanguinarius]|nr:hypothetical protein [Mycoblastus sanguinarius]
MKKALNAVKDCSFAKLDPFKPITSAKADELTLNRGAKLRKKLETELKQKQEQERREEEKVGPRTTREADAPQIIGTMDRYSYMRSKVMNFQPASTAYLNAEQNVLLRSQG